jgi:DNA-3-methyladenine glycosylase II
MYDGELSMDALAEMTDGEILASLLAVPGIGPSSAQRFMLHCLRRPDVFPAGDPTVREAITVLDQLARPITPKAAAQRSEAWRPYRSYAASYLWGYVWELNPVVAEHRRR